MTTVERVARALCAVDMEEMLRSGMAADAGSPVELAFAAVGAVDELWPNYAVQARAAIEALRPPNDELLRPMLLGLEAEGVSNLSVSGAWVALDRMVDAALAGASA